MLWGEKWTEWDNLFSDNGSFPLLHDTKAHNELLHPQRGYYDIWDKHARTIRAQAQQAAAAGFQAFMFCAPLSDRYLIGIPSALRLCMCIHSQTTTGLRTAARRSRGPSRMPFSARSQERLAASDCRFFSLGPTSLGRSGGTWPCPTVPPLASPSRSFLRNTVDQRAGKERAILASTLEHAQPQLHNPYSARPISTPRLTRPARATQDTSTSCYASFATPITPYTAVPTQS